MRVVGILKAFTIPYVPSSSVTPESYEKVLEEMRQRDYNDSHRAAAPLKQAEDAVLLDTTELDFQQSEEAILRIIRERTSR